MQQKLADGVGQSYVTISHYESGQSEPSVSHSLAIARALGTTVEEAFGDDGQRIDQRQGGAMTHQAERRVQITLEDGSGPAERTHEDRADQTPLSNIQLRPLRGQPAKFTPLGPGEVTCGNCARVHA
jgi:transcriptional regulator with XRE-family HTH domain